VFISYSHDSPDHMDRVLALADRLRQDGINAILDQYEESPAEGWPMWMAAQIRESDFVLVVCTETYLRRVERKEEPGKGHGVIWESFLTYQQLYNNAARNAKYIPLLLDGARFQDIPEPLQAATYYSVSDDKDDNGYFGLYRRLTKQPFVTKPELGGRLSLPPRQRQQAVGAAPRTNVEEQTVPIRSGDRQIQSKPWNVPYEPNPVFTGREDILEALFAGLQKNKRQALSGLGGVGKTQIAVEYAYRHRNEYAAVFWVFADSEQSLSTGFASIAKQLDLPEKDNAEQASITAAVNRWLDEQDGWLLIFDNADQPTLLRPFLPQQGRGHILLTSRAHVFQSLGIVKPLEIHELQPAEARAFLLRRTGREASKEIAEVDALAKELGYLPLALEQAGAFILEREASFANYLASFRKRRSDLLKEHNPVLGTSHAPLATTWRLNFEQVENFPASADLLCLSAFLAPDAIPLELLEKGADEVSGPLSSKLVEAKDDPLVLDEVLKSLTDYSLIRRNVETRSYSIHPLVQEVTRDGITAELQKSLAKNVIEIVDAAFPDVEFGNWPDCERLIGHALACAKSIDLFNIESETAASLLNQAAYYRSQRAQYEESEPLYRRALEIRETVLGANDPDTADTLNGLAGLYYYQGKYEESEPLYERALKIYENALGSEHPITALSVNNLAELYASQGKYREAEPLFRRALGTTEKVNGPEHPHVAAGLNNLAELYREQEKYDEAEPLHRRALEIREKALGPEHPDTAQSVSNLALVYFSQRRHQDLESLFRRALEIRQKALGPEHPDTALSLSNLAFVYSYQGRHAEAESLYRRALEIREKAFGPQHLYTLETRDNLIKLYKKQNKLAEAENLERRFKSKDKPK
jgi:tetratricopeptide (TPR) repeat protein